MAGHLGCVTIESEPFGVAQNNRGEGSPSRHRGSSLARSIGNMVAEYFKKRGVFKDVIVGEEVCVSGGYLKHKEVVVAKKQRPLQ